MEIKAYFQLIVAILATYRIAQLLPYDDGPFYIFKRIRLWSMGKATIENGLTQGLSNWNNLYDWTSCVYCQGLYAAILCGVLISRKKKSKRDYGNIFLIIFAIAGGQSLLQKWGE